MKFIFVLILFFPDAFVTVFKHTLLLNKTYVSFVTFFQILKKLFFQGSSFEIVSLNNGLFNTLYKTISLLDIYFYLLTLSILFLTF